MTVLCARGDRCRREGPRRAAHDSTLCAVCEDRMRENMRAIAAAWSDLEDAIVSPVRGAPPGERVSGGSTSDIQWGITASEIAREVRHLVFFWTRVLVDEFHAKPPHPWTTPRLLVWMAKYQVPDLSAHELGASVCDETHAASRAVASVLDSHRPRRIPVPVACPGWDDHDGHHDCEGTMQAVVTGDSLPTLHCSIDRRHTIAPMTYARRSWRPRPQWTSETPDQQ